MFFYENIADWKRFAILYEDSDIAVVFKPNGMLSVPYSGSRAKTAMDLLELIMRKRGHYSARHKPFAVHRLDRDTSGIMIFALNGGTSKQLMDNWQLLVKKRIYRAVSENPANNNLPDFGIIDSEISYNAKNIGFIPHGKNNEFKTVKARTNYKIIESGKFYSLFELELDTGRKNQIRIHLSDKGYPIAGDKVYKAKTDPFFRLALHARIIEFVHPYSGKTISFEVPEPKNWLETVKTYTHKDKIHKNSNLFLSR